MKLKDLKNALDKMTADQLNAPFFYSCESRGLSGMVINLSKAKSDLYYTGEDDPVKLYTKKQLKSDLGYDNEEIEMCDIEIPKGSLILKF